VCCLVQVRPALSQETDLVRTTIDEMQGLVIVEAPGAPESCYPLASAEGFAAASRAWLRAGWDAKHAYSFTWLGQPIIQLPEDIVRLQELIYAEKPDVIIETGVAHGGSALFFASLFEAMNAGRVIAIDVDIRDHNRIAIETHLLAHRIELIEGSSTSPAILRTVTDRVLPGEKVMVFLDSEHRRDHVMDELRAYSAFVDVGGRIVVADGIMQDLVSAPRSNPDWSWNNPQAAARAFVAEDDRFIIEEPEWRFNEGLVRTRVSHWPSCYVTRVR
jgi:cephalosporin hydroxylase